jgi:anti-sigma28 factor (negative regulator of flagellin synthesis)
MADDPIPADAAHAMQAVTRYQQHPPDRVGTDRQDRPARGRFGREVPAPATEDVQMADARKTMQRDHGDEGFETGAYKIDPHAVADAIIDRLMAGRILPTRPADQG